LLSSTPWMVNAGNPGGDAKKLWWLDAAVIGAAANR
jgi:hypothetical protein